MSESIRVISEARSYTLGIPRGNQFSIGLENSEGGDSHKMTHQVQNGIRDDTKAGTITNVEYAGHEDKCSLAGEHSTAGTQLTLDGAPLPIIPISTNLLSLALIIISIHF